MHEMAIAEGILDIVLDYAARNQATKVTKIQLLLGEMSGVETDALQFCFEALSKKTMAEGTNLTLHRVPLMGHCKDCDATTQIERYRFLCPHCDSANLEIVSGRELQVEFLEVD